MKKVIPVLLFLAINILYSCKKDVTNLTVGIDVQSSFNNDNVQLLIDGNQLMNRPLQTDYALGVCYVDGQIVLTKNKGTHEIKVVVNNTITKTETFSLSNALYIGINYDRQIQKISFIYSHTRFMYD